MRSCPTSVTRRRWIAAALAPWLVAAVLCGGAHAQTGARPAAPAAADLPRGEIVDRVVCAADASQSYALYLPSTYTPDRAWPIVYCFDPAARGREPVERFRQAAERFGWIVAGSWQSRNGRMEASVAAGFAMWEDTHKRFRIDDRRVYTAGFSGGARVATWSAMTCDGCIAGVIACGASFPNSRSPIASEPKEKLRFAYFATVGVDDFNFPELFALGPALDRQGVPNQVAQFDGSHDWAPASLLVEAVGWMETEAMRTGARPRDAALVDALYAEGLARAREAERAGRAYDAWRANTALVRQFASLRDTADAAAAAKALEGAKPVRDGRKADEEQIKRQQRLASEIASWESARADADLKGEAILEFKRRVADIRAKARQTEDSAERRVARRVLHLLFANYFEGGSNAALAGKHDRAAAMLEVATELAPRWPGVFFALATERLKTGDRRKAIVAIGDGLEGAAGWGATAGSEAGTR